MKNRKKFCGRIATGDYDAVIIGHSQFEKIPMSAERQKTILQNQLDEIINGIIEAKTENAERYTVKQMEKTKRGLEAKIKKLNDQERKDDVVTFEEIGVDRVFVDEGHYYKNLFHLLYGVTLRIFGFCLCNTVQNLIKLIFQNLFLSLRRHRYFLKL